MDPAGPATATSATDRATVVGPRSAMVQPSGRVLLAEDSRVNQRVAVAMLENLGFQVDVVADGAEAVGAATRTAYHAILMDCQIPVLDGYQATAEIRRLPGSFGRTPIIAITASATKSDRQRCLAAGMDDHLAKPLSLTALADVLARWAPDGPVPTKAVGPAVPKAAVPHVAMRGGPAHAADLGRPVLDAEVVGRLERLGESVGEDLVGQLASLFLADADARVAALRRAVADGDAAAVARSAHTLSGASANLGASDLSWLCATLATHGAGADLVGCGALLDALEAELGRVRSALGSLTRAP